MSENLSIAYHNRDLHVILSFGVDLYVESCLNSSLDASALNRCGFLSVLTVLFANTGILVGLSGNGRHAGNCRVWGFLA